MDAAAYVRISLDKAGQGLGVQRQEEDTRELAARRGWTVTKVFSDNDLSAYSGKARPGFEALLKAIESEEVQAVVAWHPDRMYRRGKDLVRLIDTVQANKCQIATVTAGDIDLNTPAGRMQARIIGAVSEHESEHKAERQRRAFLQMREDGKPHGGGRSYGYSSKGMLIIPEEAAIVREMAGRILAGESAWKVADDLTIRGVPTARGGKRWNANTITDLLRRASLSGRLEYKYNHDKKRLNVNGRVGEIIGPGNWQPILSVEDSDKLRALLSPRGRTSGFSERKRLLSGIATCGKCGHPLWGWQGGQQAKKGEDGKRHYVSGASRTLYYSCPNRKMGGLGGCGSLVVKAAPVDEFVTEAVLQAAERGGLGALLSMPDSEALAELDKVEQNLDLLARDHGAGEISRQEWEAARAPLQVRRKDLERRVNIARARMGLIASDGPGLRSAWPGLTLAQKRAQIQAYTEKIEVMPALKMGAGSRPAERVKIAWK